MAHRKREKDLLDFPHALEVDRSWYQSYWYDLPEPEPAKPSIHVAAIVAVLVLGVLIGL